MNEDKAIWFNGKLHHELDVYCAKKKRTIKDVAEEALTSYLLNRK